MNYWYFIQIGNLKEYPNRTFLSYWKAAKFFNINLAEKFVNTRNYYFKIYFVPIMYNLMFLITYRLYMVELIRGLGTATTEVEDCLIKAFY